jgi:hypothetical protein
MKGALLAAVVAVAGGLVASQNLRRQQFGAEPSCAVGLSTFSFTMLHYRIPFLINVLSFFSPRAQLKT